MTRERAACATALGAAGWSVGPSVTNFLLVDFGAAERPAAVAEGLLRRASCRARSAPATRSRDHLRLTVRDPDENDRLIAAAADHPAAGEPPR